MSQNRRKAMVVGITGASGSIYGVKLIQTLLGVGYNVHLVVSNAGWRVIKEELGWDVSDRNRLIEEHFSGYEGDCVYHPINDIGASIASGSYLVEGMIVMPCSMGTLSSIANGTSDNLMARAADVMLKELFYEHHIVSPTDLSRLQTAFFNMNGVLSIVVFTFTLIDLVVQSH